MSHASISRRRFLGQMLRSSLLISGIGFTLPDVAGRVVTPPARDYIDTLIREAPAARYWISTATDPNACATCHGQGAVANTLTVTHEQTFVQCRLCAQECIIHEGARGKCQTRMNINGELKTLVYGRPISTHIDPIEKKPLYHFLPGASAFSMATAGCPLSCRFCQNWQISQAKPEDYRTDFVSPEQIVRATESREVPVIAFTYNEPTVFTEYLIDIARQGKQRGIRSVLISCGFMNAEPLADMCEVLDAIKIDLKGFSQDFYTKVCDARLQPVLNSIRQIAKTDTHLELVNLVVPTLNDSDQMLTELVDWVYNEVGPDVPIHFTRFHPDYKLRNLPPTPIATLERARSIALDNGLRYPFVGNVPGHPGNHTYCPACGKIVIDRSGFFVRETHIRNGRCEYCEEPIAGVWS